MASWNTSTEAADNDSKSNPNPETVEDSAKSKAVLDYHRKLYKSQEHTDFSIDIKETTFPVHLIVVSASCQYFRCLSTREIWEQKVSFPDISFKTMQCILKFCYTGELPATEENYCDIILCASKLQIIELLNLCQNQVAKFVNKDNYWRVFALGRSCALEKLSRGATKYCRDNLGLVVNGSNFVKLDPRDIASIFRSFLEKIDSMTEQQLYQAVIGDAKSLK